MSRTEIVLTLLDDVLAEKFGGNKLENLRRIERAAKRMADRIEHRERGAPSRNQEIEHE